MTTKAEAAPSCKHQVRWLLATTLLALTPDLASASPILSSDRIAPANMAPDDHLGAAVAVSEDTIVVGARLDDEGELADSGAAYVFVRDGEGWVEEAKLVADEPHSEAHFGKAVSLSGDTILVASNEGVYVFERSGRSWLRGSTLRSEDPEEGFGESLSVSGDWALIGAPWSQDRSGAAYLYFHDQDSWVRGATLRASDASKENYFGHSVSISGSRALVGAHRNEQHGHGSGAAYLFSRGTDHALTWSQEAKLSPQAAREDQFFGFAVALSGRTALIGDLEGAGTIFTLDGSGWSEEATLVTDNEGKRDGFVASVAVSDERAMLGTSWGNTTTGTAHVFALAGDSWILEDSYQPDTLAGYKFGYSVALSGQTALVGAPAADDSGELTGSAYAFQLGELPAAEDSTGDEGQGGCSVGGQGSGLAGMLLLALMAVARRRSTAS
jgi:hypothetical protein